MLPSPAQRRIVLWGLTSVVVLGVALVRLPPSDAAPDGAVAQVPAPTRTATPSPFSRPTVPAGLPRVAPSSPERITIRGLVDAAFDAPVQPVEGHLVPRTRNLVAPWGGRGLPGSPAADTVVLVGSMRDEDGAAFRRLPDLAAGARVVITTANGRLTYLVDTVGRHPSVQQVVDPLFDRDPGRLVLVGARYDGGGDRQYDDVLVQAHLVGASR